jgi:hypothetical protein
MLESDSIPAGKIFILAPMGFYPADDGFPKKVADAWQPLYHTLTPDQKRRMAALALFVLRDLRDAVEHRRLQFEDSDDEE